MRSAKAVEVAGDVGALLLALAFPLLTLVLTLDPQSDSVRVLGVSVAAARTTRGPLTWLLVGPFCIALVEAVAHILRANLSIDEAKLAAAVPHGDIGAREPLRRMVITRSLTTAFVLAAVFVLLLVACVSYVVGNRVRLTVPTYVLLATYAVYLVSRRRLVRAARCLLEPLRRWQVRSLPRVSLDGDTVVVDLTPSGLRRRGGDGVMRIGLGELEQVQMLTYREATALGTYEIGPDLSYAKAHVENLYRFGRGEIERPEVYLPQLSTGSPVLMLRGPRLMYLVNVAEEPADVLAAFGGR